jgi:hypothetical protein
VIASMRQAAGTCTGAGRIKYTIEVLHPDLCHAATTSSCAGVGLDEGFDRLQVSYNIFESHRDAATFHPLLAENPQQQRCELAPVHGSMDRRATESYAGGRRIVVNRLVATANVLLLQVVVRTSPLRLEARHAGAAERRHRPRPCGRRPQASGDQRRLLLLLLLAGCLLRPRCWLAPGSSRSDPRPRRAAAAAARARAAARKHRAAINRRHLLASPATNPKTAARAVAQPPRHPR